MDAGERFQAKRLTVKPGAVLSLQMHRHRAKHWVVVKERTEQIVTIPPDLTIAGRES